MMMYHHNVSKHSLFEGQKKTWRMEDGGWSIEHVGICKQLVTYVSKCLSWKPF